MARLLSAQMHANSQGAVHGTAGPATEHDLAGTGLTPTGIQGNATHQQDEGDDGDKESGDECGHGGLPAKDVTAVLVIAGNVPEG
jgi:hypothetical protein